MWWVFAYIAALVLIFCFNRGSNRKPSELHARDRYNATLADGVCPRCGSTNVTQEADYCFSCKWSKEDEQ